MQEKIEKWSRWLDAIRRDLRGVAIRGHLYRELAKIVSTNPTLPQTSDLYWYLAVEHSQAMSMAIRRQVKRGQDSISLASLLEDIAEHADILTKERIMEGLHEAFAARFRREFGALANSTGNHANPDIVRTDLAELRSAAGTIEGYADRVVAHLDKRQPKEWPRFEDLYEAMQLMEKILYRYIFLVDRSLGGSLMAGFDDRQWRLPLMHAWIT